ncbi:Large-conductance mechanosensitive channel [Planctopirus ephydatiae]|uniref:Large-conductance mechanosensitive channel n=1 Tax=Planctopirus ephydatiae TaxID=2528019 RepID=A0A518GI29_9PLAN|nr:large-conductance mechanosensitive channel protein MscL [Planctopirus ephydatiae]QDV28242.1 Large-conductance mechanosensitive channel [Planctopirus ephydatiae]
MGLIHEFKEFAMRGNVIDMAVGIVTGAAFTSIVTSLVKNIITPPIGALLKGADFSKLSINIPVPAVAAGEVAYVPISYGLFLQSVFDFVIIAMVLFMVLKGINSLKRKQAAEEAAPPVPTRDQELLMEIRDLLKAQSTTREKE